MAKPRRALTDTERAKACGFCGARPGERCTNPDGSFYSTGAHAAREGADGRLNRGFGGRDPDEEYPVDTCGHCSHPGGQHVLGGGCRLCAICPGWDAGSCLRDWWSDRMTDELLAAMEEGNGNG